MFDAAVHYGHFSANFGAGIVANYWKQAGKYIIKTQIALYTNFAGMALNKRFIHPKKRAATEPAITFKSGPMPLSFASEPLEAV